VHAGVDGAYCLGCALGLRSRAERDQVERLERTPEPAPQIAVVVGVLNDAGRDERVGDLEEDGRAAAQERCER
jgi:hypothetical protein